MIDLAVTATRLASDGLPVADLAVLDARHADRPVLHGRLDERPVVVKCHAEPRTAERGHRAAVSIWHGTASDGDPGIVPQPLGWSAAAAAVVSERVTGTALGARGHLGGAVTNADAVAHLLARLHSVPADHRIAERDLGGVVRSTRRKADELPSAAGRLASIVADLLAEAVAERDADDLVVTHGDFTPRNLLLDPAGRLRLIDLDRVRLAPAGRDVGYWRAWCWATVAMSGDRPDWSTTDSFVDTYVGRRGCAASLALHTAAGLVRIAHGWSALASLPDLQELVVAEAVALAGALIR